MSAHTPGPWEAGETDRVLTGPHREEYACWYVTGEDGTDEGVLVAKLDSDDTGAETEANAHLIAAAPEMLAALYIARDQIREFLPNALGDALGKIEAAIAKAEGDL